MKEKINIDGDGIFPVSEEIGFKYLLSRQTDRIGFISTHIDINFVQTITNFGAAIRTLEMMLKSKWDDKYKESTEILEDKISVQEILDGWFIVFGNLMELMDRQNLSFEKSTEEEI